MSVSDSILTVSAVTKTFNRFVALDAVTLSLPLAEKRALIGPNGAGKSTLMNVIGGQLAADSGDIFLQGQSVRNMPAHRRARLGIGRTFQISNVFGRLTALENVLSGLNAISKMPLSLFPTRLRADRDEATALLRAVGLEADASRNAEELSHGDRKRLELAMVLGLNPRILLLDEPTAGMGPSERRALVDLIVTIADKRRLTLVFVEHDIDTVFRVADQITVMARGKVLAEGTPEAIRRDRNVQDTYLGRAPVTEVSS